MADVTLSDIAALTRDNDGWGNGSWWVIILFAMIYGWGGNGWGNNNNGLANAIGYENLATSNEVQRGFDNQNSMANQREILSAVNSGTAQALAATNQTFHDTLMALSDKYMELQRDIAGVAVSQANVLANQNQCCCETKMLIQDVASQQRYESAMQNNATIQAIQAEGSATRAMIQQDKYEQLQMRYNDLNQRLNTQEMMGAINAATAGVVRYPDSFAYNAGNNPFCGCGSNNGCCNI